MKHLILCSVFLLIFFGLAAENLRAQSERINPVEQYQDPVADWLDPDTPLLVTLTDVSETVRRLKTLSFFNNPKVAKALQLLTDQRFPVLSPDDIEIAKDKLFAIESLLDTIKRLNFVVHRYDAQTFEWSLFLQASPEAQDELQQVLVELDQLYKEKVKITRYNGVTQGSQIQWSGIGSTKQKIKELQAQQKRVQPEKKRPDEEVPTIDGAASEANANDSLSDIKNLGWAKLKRFENWLVLSNKTALLTTLENRIGNDEYRSLAKSRKYKGILNTTSKTRDEPGALFVYGTPHQMAQLTPYLSERDYKELKIHEMPAFGIALAILDTETQATNRPIVIGECIVKFTKPAVGRAKTTLLHQPVQIPKLAQRPIELHAAARDELAINNEIVKNYDEIYGEGAAYKYWDTHYADYLIDLQEDALPRRKSIIDYRFIDDDHPIDQPGIITIETAKEPNALARYARAIAEKAAENAPFIDSIENDIQWWKRKDFHQSSGVSAISRWQIFRVDLINLMHDAYALNDRFWVQGDLPAIERQVDLMVNNHGIDYGEPIRKIIDDLSRRLKATGPPIKVIFYRPDSWHENLKKLEDNHLGKMRVNFQPNPTAKENSDLQISISYQNLQKRKPRDEFGIPFEVVNQDDLTMAIELMLRRALAESFPRQLFIYTKTESHFRILLGAYPDEVDDRTKK